jgi:hypothetical protein
VVFIVDANDVYISEISELERSAPGTASNVQHSHARLEAQPRHEVMFVPSDGGREQVSSEDPSKVKVFAARMVHGLCMCDTKDCEVSLIIRGEGRTQ